EFMLRNRWFPPNLEKSGARRPRSEGDTFLNSDYLCPGITAANIKTCTASSRSKR
ncbi:hypothetical protein AURDEDRAFT_110225, partial [Auricularia subglabra TFB-10046 SS5]